MSNNNDKRTMPRTFAESLRLYRQKRHLTCKQLGDLAGIDAGYVNRLELGKRRAPSYPVIKNLAKALNIDVTDLINIEPNEDDAPKKSIQEVLVYNEYLINGKLPSMTTRENLLALMQTMLDCEWEKNSKHMDSVNIISRVDTFLRSLK